MSNIPGTNNPLPDVFTSVETQSKGASVPGGARIACIIGEGSRNEVVVSSALGSGADGFNPTYTSTNGSDGRHFALSLFPVISNRTQLFRNGIPLVGIEEQIDSNSFSKLYDYRLDIATGHIEMQTAHLVDQGGSFYSVGASNVGTGSVQNLTLPDVNAPTETWTIKCVSVQRTSLNVPIAQTAKFSAFGSVSGNVLDANGNPILWVANNIVVSNTILSFSILETTTPFREGDFFTIKVSSGVLNKNDSLTATYIAAGSLNDPTFFDSMQELASKHGAPSLSNTLSLGAQLAFANTPPGVMALQAAPAIPRRTSYTLVENFAPASTNPSSPLFNVDDFVIPFAPTVSPDIDANIHFFVTNATTGIESQILPNKFTYFELDKLGQPTTDDFVKSDVMAPSGYDFFYTVVQKEEAVNFAVDGYLNRFLSTNTDAYFSSSTVGSFDSSYIDMEVKVLDGYNGANNGTFTIVGVSNGVLHIQATGSPPFSDYINESSMTFEVIEPTTNTVVAGSYATDGQVIAIATTATGTFSSGTVNFTTLPGFNLGLKLRVLTATNPENLGLFDITANPSSNSLTIAKSFVSEHSLKFEVIDPSGPLSDFLVINHNVLTTGQSLRVTLVDTKDAGFFDAGWETALAVLETQEIDILVPLPSQTISVIFQNCLNHCITMSNTANKKERVLFIGAINGLIPANLTGAKLAAVENIGILEGIQGDTVAEILAGSTEDLANYSVPNAYGTTFRAVYFFPDQIVVQVGADNQILDGFYISAAAAGFLCATPNIAMPLTNKVLSGFTILKNRMFSPSVLSSLAAAGVCVLQPVSGGGRVLWGKTTTQSGFPEEEEISIVFIRDRVAKSMRAGFAGFIGQPQSPDTIPSITSRAISLLNSFVSQKLITDYADLTVKVDSVDPTQINVGVRVAPTYPTNFIYIKVSVGTL